MDSLFALIPDGFFYGLSFQWLLLLFFVALIAGWVDSIAGGGGMIVLPTLIMAGLPPGLAIATNKIQSCGGTGYASFYFIRQGLMRPQDCKLMILMTLIGTILGGWLVFRINLDVLAQLIPILLILIGIIMIFRPELGAIDQERRLSPLLFAIVVAGGLGFYDGFFGPGTGTFFAMAFIALAGYNLTKATIHTKLLNFVSNFGALGYFALFEQLVWGIGLVMFFGQILGSMIGSRMVVKNGQRLIRPILILVSFALAFKLLI